MIAETTAGVKELTKAIGRKPKASELEAATALLCHAGDEFSAADYAAALFTLDQATRQLTEFFEKYDTILTLTMPFPAPKIGEFKLQGNEKLGLNLLRYLPFGPTLRQLLQRAAEKKLSFMSFTALFNIGGNPAMSVPLYWDKNGMPIGIQFAGKLNQDAILFQLARQLEEAQPWEDRKPEIIKSRMPEKLFVQEV
jgi:amidase